MAYITTYSKALEMSDERMQGDVGVVNRLYVLQDTWKPSAPGGMFRFQETVRVVRDLRLLSNGQGSVRIAYWEQAWY